MEWRYLPNGRVVHALTGTSDAGAVCGVYALPASEWRGTGNQNEYEQAAALPKCRRCVARIGGGR